MIDRNELWAQTEELADLIIQAPEVQAFQDAEEALQGNPNARSMMNQLKSLQEEVQEYQARKVPPKHYVHLLQDSESLLEQLEKIPEVKAFQAAQAALNDLLQTVTRRLASAVLERVADMPEGG